MEPAEARESATNVDAVSQDRDSCDDGCSIGSYKPIVRDFIAQNALTISICLVILATGLVGCAILFVYLCFRYPDSANIVLPLIMLPIGSVAIKQGKKVADVIIKSRANKIKDTAK